MIALSNPRTKERKTSWICLALSDGKHSRGMKQRSSHQENEEVWRISLPDGKRERLPDILNGVDPADGEIQMSHDDKQIVFLRGQIDARLVLIDNLFK